MFSLMKSGGKPVLPYFQTSGNNSSWIIPHFNLSWPHVFICPLIEATSPSPPAPPSYNHMSADGGGLEAIAATLRSHREDVASHSSDSSKRTRAAEASVMLKGNLTELKLHLYADVQNTEHLKTTASALLLPNTDKIRVFPSCLYVPGCEVHSY